MLKKGNTVYQVFTILYLARYFLSIQKQTSKEYNSQNNKIFSVECHQDGITDILISVRNLEKMVNAALLKINLSASEKNKVGSIADKSLTLLFESGIPQGEGICPEYMFSCLLFSYFIERKHDRSKFIFFSHFFNFEHYQQIFDPMQDVENVSWSNHMSVCEKITEHVIKSFPY